MQPGMVQHIPQAVITAVSPWEALMSIHVHSLRIVYFQWKAISTERFRMEHTHLDLRMSGGDSTGCGAEFYVVCRYECLLKFVPSPSLVCNIIVMIEMVYRTPPIPAWVMRLSHTPIVLGGDSVTWPHSSQPQLVMRLTSTPSILGLGNVTWSRPCQTRRR